MNKVSIRNYKKKYYICEDDFGNRLYPGDTVEIYLPCELSTTWTSIIYWSMLYGAWVDSHPIHKSLSNNEEQRMLHGLIGQTEFRKYTYGENDETYIIKQGYCKKIKSFNKR